MIRQNVLIGIIMRSGRQRKFTDADERARAIMNVQDDKQWQNILNTIGQGWHNFDNLLNGDFKFWKDIVTHNFAEFKSIVVPHVRQWLHANRKSIDTFILECDILELVTCPVTALIPGANVLEGFVGLTLLGTNMFVDSMDDIMSPSKELDGTGRVAKVVLLDLLLPIALVKGIPLVGEAAGEALWGPAEVVVTKNAAMCKAVGQSKASGKLTRSFWKKASRAKLPRAAQAKVAKQLAKQQYKAHFLDLEKEELVKVILPEKMGAAASIVDRYFKISDRLFEKYWPKIDEKDVSIKNLIQHTVKAGSECLTLATTVLSMPAPRREHEATFALIAHTAHRCLSCEDRCQQLHDKLKERNKDNYAVKFRSTLSYQNTAKIFDLCSAARQEVAATTKRWNWWATAADVVDMANLLLG